MVKDCREWKKTVLGVKVRNDCSTGGKGRGGGGGGGGIKKKTQIYTIIAVMYSTLRKQEFVYPHF
jgi:hypothetical protein